jgi:hypothetical protein
MKQPDDAQDLTDWERNAERYAQTIGAADDRIYPQLREVMWACLGDLRGRADLGL